MSANSIAVERAPAFLTVQDLGRAGYRAQGVPPGGAMDPWSAAAANLAVGNEPRSAVLEWALSGGAVRFEIAAPRAAALTGAEVEATLAGSKIPSGAAAFANPGDVLRVERFVTGRFVYLAIAGGVDVPLVLGSRSTLLVAGIGGFAGRRLATGDRIPVGEAPAVSTTSAAARFETMRDGGPIRIVPGPHWDEFEKAERARLLSPGYRVAAASDRVGYRLEGPSIRARADGEIRSEAVAVGAIEIPAGGTPIVLMPDGPTTGGFRQIAIVAAADLAGLAQRVPGTAVRFELTTLGEARRAYADLAERCGIC